MYSSWENKPFFAFGAKRSMHRTTANVTFSGGCKYLGLFSWNRKVPGLEQLELAKIDTYLYTLARTRRQTMDPASSEWASCCIDLLKEQVDTIIPTWFLSVGSAIKALMVGFFEQFDYSWTWNERMFARIASNAEHFIGKIDWSVRLLDI